MSFMRHDGFLQNLKLNVSTMQFYIAKVDSAGMSNIAGVWIGLAEASDDKNPFRWQLDMMALHS